MGNALLEAALTYAKRGWHVFPIHWPVDGKCSCGNADCENQGKHPLTQNGFKDATRDPKIMTEWWTKWPAANIGIATGDVSGIVVIDIDAAEAKDGLKAILPPDYDINSVPRSGTGRGWHLVFAHPGVEIKNRTGILPKVDVRGDGGYFIVWPSMHVSGKQYKWQVAPVGELRKLPVELYKFITSSNHNGAGERERFNSSVVWEGIPEGQRDHDLFRYACQLRSFNAPRDVTEELIVAAAARCRPPFPTDKALEKVSQAWKYPAGHSNGTANGNGNGAADFVSSPIENKPCAINFPLQTWAQFLATDFDEQPYTIEGLAPDSGLIAFHGRGKDGKTTFLIHACRAVASGQAFLDKRTIKKPVVYVNYEMGFSYLQKLLSAGGECPERAYLLNRPEPVLQMATIEATMQEVNRPGVMVIDSFRGAFRLHGDAENSAGGAGVILRSLQDLAFKHKWLLVVIHHRNRSAKEGTDSISGTSDWIAAPDVIWTWSRTDKEKSGTLTIEGRMTPVEPMAVKLSPEECVFVGTLEESQEETDKSTIVAALTDEGQTAADIAEAIKKPASTVRKRLEVLFDGGLVNREGEGKRGSPFLYSKINCAQNIPLREETNWEPI